MLRSYYVKFIPGYLAPVYSSQIITTMLCKKQILNKMSSYFKIKCENKQQAVLSRYPDMQISLCMLQQHYYATCSAFYPSFHYLLLYTPK